MYDTPKKLLPFTRMKTFVQLRGEVNGQQCELSDEETRASSSRDGEVIEDREDQTRARIGKGEGSTGLRFASPILVPHRLGGGVHDLSRMARGQLLQEEREEGRTLVRLENQKRDASAKAHS